MVIPNNKYLSSHLQQVHHLNQLHDVQLNVLPRYIQVDHMMESHHPNIPIQILLHNLAVGKTSS